MNARGLGSQLKDSIPVTELSASGPFESHDLLRKGFSCVKNELLPSHPLELSEKNFQLNQDKMNFSTLRNIQGLFAPLKLQMEFKALWTLLTSASLFFSLLNSLSICLSSLRHNAFC
uniref:Proteasome maturation protein n=1 Tax=Microcebus murinus TaxID=30608 RepID=A0A8C5YES8_MICMU